jgi:phage baseplate assembly protein W
MKTHDIPHLAFPFRFEQGRAVTVEQDSYDDVFGCVEVIARTPRGSRFDSPDFGIPALELGVQPVERDSVVAAIESWEERAQIDLLDNVRSPDELIDTMTLAVGGHA